MTRKSLAKTIKVIVYGPERPGHWPCNGKFSNQDVAKLGLWSADFYSPFSILSTSNFSNFFSWIYWKGKSWRIFKGDTMTKWLTDWRRWVHTLIYDKLGRKHELLKEFLPERSSPVYEEPVLGLEDITTILVNKDFFCGEITFWILCSNKSEERKLLHGKDETSKSEE